MAHLGFNRLFTGSRRDLVASNIEPSSGRNKINLKNKSKGLTRLPLNMKIKRPLIKIFLDL